MFGSYLPELLIVKETKTKKTKNYSMKIERNVLSIVGSTNDGKWRKLMIDFKDMIQLSHGMTIYLTNLFLTFNNMYIQARAFFSSNGLIRTFRFPLLLL